MDARFHLLGLSPLYATVFDFLMLVLLITTSVTGDDNTLSSVNVFLIGLELSDSCFKNTNISMEQGLSWLPVSSTWIPNI